MANSDQSNEEGGTLDAASTAAAGMTAKGASRRRFAKVGAGASAGVIMTLASQPGMAQTVCTSPSGMMSGNVSFHSDHNICLGRSTGFWREHPEAWPGASTAPEVQFTAIFKTTARTQLLDPYTCMQVMTPQELKQTKGFAAVVDPDPDNVAMHIVATLLNVRSGRINFLTENQVLGIWNSYAAKGTYVPSVGVTWNGYQIVQYLSKTMG